MNRKALSALKASIKKWEAKEKTVEENLGKFVDIDCGLYTCPLCMKFNRSTDDDCKECPIYAVTKQKFCRGTPFHKAYNLIDKKFTLRTLAACHAEVVFLKSLLPKAGKK
jgi:hypothetical protein